MTSLMSGVKLGLMKKGIYLVQPQHTELKIIYNQQDAEKAGDPSTILKVNKENIKRWNHLAISCMRFSFKKIFKK